VDDQPTYLTKLKNKKKPLLVAINSVYFLSFVHSLHERNLFGSTSVVDSWVLVGSGFTSWFNYWVYTLLVLKFEKNQSNWIYNHPTNQNWEPASG